MSQYSIETLDYLKNNRSIYEVMYLANNANGEIVSTSNPLPVTLGSENITITGNVTVDNFPATQNVSIVTESPLPVIGTTVNPWGKQVLSVDDDTVQHTSKNRRKVSTYEVTDFSKFLDDKDPGVWDELITGTASATHEPYMGMVRLEVGSDAGDEVIRQSKRVQIYIPGRQNEASMTVIFGTPTAGIRRRMGVFNDVDGAFFEDGGDGTYYAVCRRDSASGVVETRVAREDWNVDKLDGTGPTGIIADPETIQLMVIEYEWYGAGQVEFNFVIGNNKIPVHQFDHANISTTTWSSTGSLPIRVELTNVTGTAGTHTFYQGSHSFSTEGTTRLLGRQRAVSNPVTGRTLSSANTFYPVLAIRLKTTSLNSVVIPDEFACATLDNTNIFVRVIEGAIITGGTWVSYGADSPIEYNITATGFTDGRIISTQFISAGNMGGKNTFQERSITQLQRNTTTTLGDTSSTFMIAISATGSNKDAWAAMGWIEVR
jgi:hypothetical protein